MGEFESSNGQGKIANFERVPKDIYLYLKKTVLSCCGRVLFARKNKFLKKAFLNCS